MYTAQNGLTKLTKMNALNHLLIINHDPSSIVQHCTTSSSLYTGSLVLIKKNKLE